MLKKGDPWDEDNVVLCDFPVRIEKIDVENSNVHVDFTVLSGGEYPCNIINIF